MLQFHSKTMARAERELSLRPTQSFGFQWRADGKRHWIRVDARDGAAHLGLLGNPIYLQGR
jgi:hypothetical protein